MNEPLLDERVDDLALLLEASPEQLHAELWADAGGGFEDLSTTTPEVWLG